MIVPLARFTLHSSLSAEEYTDRLKALLQSNRYAGGLRWYEGSFKEGEFILRPQRASRFDRRAAPICLAKIETRAPLGICIRVAVKEPGIVAVLSVLLSLMAVALWRHGLAGVAPFAAGAVLVGLGALAQFHQGLSFVREMLVAASAPRPPELRGEESAPSTPPRRKF